jgi:hypothetical protein
MTENTILFFYIKPGQRAASTDHPGEYYIIPGEAAWASQSEESDIVCLGGERKRISEIRALNDAPNVGEFKVVRDGRATVFYASDGVRYAYRANGMIIGDLDVWNAFDEDLLFNREPR